MGRDGRAAPRAPRTLGAAGVGSPGARGVADPRARSPRGRASACRVSRHRLGSGLGPLGAAPAAERVPPPPRPRALRQLPPQPSQPVAVPGLGLGFPGSGGLTTGFGGTLGRRKKRASTAHESLGDLVPPLAPRGCDHFSDFSLSLMTFPTMRSTGQATLLQASGTSSYCNDSQEPPCLHSPFATQQPGAATKMKIRAHLPPLPTLENSCCSENKMALPRITHSGLKRSAGS
ncbi:uncharacterized protein LOC119872301 [Canis lupus familiaris]|uniref:uncharacterized protein LOC119872301 n=1 Tax=Canis lupus familiaris TaxID=9615 RepID=UPI0015F1556A|nr:uncharacterized protein LOC119872301 [Canis lupus familiaris]XP_038394859.1 uncharacterized protein LOC119872301 [Canis lupus familiaris]